MERIKKANNNFDAHFLIGNFIQFINTLLRATIKYHVDLE